MNIERTIIALAVAVVLSNCLVGCDQKPTSESNAASSQTSDQPSVAKSNTDPVASLRQLASEIPAGKEFQWTDEEMAEWNSKQNMEWREKPTFSFNAESVDVEKTNSLVTPYIGYLVLRVSGEDDRWPEIRVVLAWQENHWVGKKIERKTEPMITYAPIVRLIMRVVPVEWNLEKTSVE